MIRLLSALLLLALAASSWAASFVSGLRDHTHDASGQGGVLTFIGTDPIVRSFAAGRMYVTDTGCTYGTNCYPQFFLMGENESTLSSFLTIFGRDSTGTVVIESQGHGYPLKLVAENNSGTDVELVSGDPDLGTSAFQIYGDDYPPKICMIDWTYSGSLSTIKSTNCSISDATGTGNFDVSFDAGLFGSNPYCTCQTQTAGFCNGRGVLNSTTWQLETRNTSATLTDLSGTAICRGFP